MNAHQAQFISHKLQELKDLYAELLMLLDRSTQEDPMTETTGGLDKIITPILAGAGRALKEFREETRVARQLGLLPEALEAEIQEFESQLRLGLEMMVERIHRRADELGQERDKLRERLKQVKRMQRGAQGYRPRAAASAWLDSSM